MKDLKKLVFLLVSMSMSVGGFAQTAEEYEANYAKRITQEVLNGVYIPLDLNDAFHELDRLSEPNGIARFKKAPEEEIRRRLHFGLGRWILINWGLEDGSRISHSLKLKGISVPDDMVRVIIVSWHRYLHGKPLRLEEEIALIEKRMAEEKVKRDAQKTIISVEKRPHKNGE
jgi:hypothetical protein